MEVFQHVIHHWNTRAYFGTTEIALQYLVVLKRQLAIARVNSATVAAAVLSF